MADQGSVTRSVTLELEAKLRGADPFEKMAASAARLNQMAQPVSQRLAQAVQRTPFGADQARDVERSFAKAADRIGQRFADLRQRLAAAGSWKGLAGEEGLDLLGISRADRGLLHSVQQAQDSLARLRAQAARVAIGGDESGMMRSLSRVQGELLRLQASTRTLAHGGLAGFERAGSGLMQLTRGLTFLSSGHDGLEKLAQNLARVQGLMDTIQGGRSVLTGLVGGLVNLSKAAGAMRTVAPLQAELAASERMVAGAMSQKAAASALATRALTAETAATNAAAAANARYTATSRAGAAAKGVGSLSDLVQMGGNAGLPVGLGRAGLSFAGGAGAAEGAGAAGGLGLGGIGGAAWTVGLPVAAVLGAAGAFFIKGGGEGAENFTANLFTGNARGAFGDTDGRSLWQQVKQGSYAGQAYRWLKDRLPRTGAGSGAWERMRAERDLARRRYGATDEDLDAQNDQEGQMRGQLAQEDLIAQLNATGWNAHLERTGGKFDPGFAGREMRRLELNRWRQDSLRAEKDRAQRLIGESALFARGNRVYGYEAAVQGSQFELEASRRAALRETSSPTAFRGLTAALAGHVATAQASPFKGTAETDAAVTRAALAKMQAQVKLNALLREQQQLADNIKGTDSAKLEVAQRIAQEQEHYKAAEEQEMEAKKAQASAEQGRLQQLRSFAAEQVQFLRTQIELENEKERSQRKQFGLMSALDRQASVRIAGKLSRGETLSKQEIGFARGVSLFNEPLGRYAEKQAEKFPEYGAIRKLLGLDERRKEMEAAKAGAEKIQANILNAVTVAVQANEAEIARQLGVAVDQRMPIWLKQVGILFDAKLAQQNFQNFAGGVGNQAIKGQQ